jgi:hypothetical protein
MRYEGGLRTLSMRAEISICLRPIKAYPTSLAIECG